MRSPRVAGLHAAIVEIPLRRPFATARDRLARQVARQVRLYLELDDGRRAVADAIPVHYVTGETPESVLRAAGDAAPLVAGLGLDDSSAWEAALVRIEGASLRAGVEMALHTAASAVLSVSLWRRFGGAVSAVRTDITVSLGEDGPARAREVAQAGFDRIKVKVGGASADDIAQLRAIHEAVPGARLRIDANQAYDADGALAFLGRLADLGLPIELIEQPVDKNDLRALDRVAADSPFPVLADEAVIDTESASRVLHRTRAHGVNVKLMKCGVRGTVAVARMARECGKLAMIGCMLEGHRGIGFATSLACGLGTFDYVDLDSHMLLAGDETGTHFVQTGPELRCLDAAPRLESHVEPDRASRPTE